MVDTDGLTAYRISGRLLYLVACAEHPSSVAYRSLSSAGIAAREHYSKYHPFGG